MRDGPGNNRHACNVPLFAQTTPQSVRRRHCLGLLQGSLATAPVRLAQIGVEITIISRQALQSSEREFKDEYP
jgi:hypothetical protein